MIDWDEIAGADETRKLRRQVATLQDGLALLTRTTARLGEELNRHNDDYEAHYRICDVILGEFTPAGQRGYEAAIEAAIKEAADG